MLWPCHLGSHIDPLWFWVQHGGHHLREKRKDQIRFSKQAELNSNSNRFYSRRGLFPSLTLLHCWSTYILLCFLSLGIWNATCLDVWSRKNERERSWAYCCSSPITMNIYLIDTSTTITRKMLTITEMARIPLKMPMMLPQPADGSVSPCVVVGGLSGDVVGVVEPVVTTCQE